MYRLILALCCVGLVVGESVIVYNHQNYTGTLGISCSIENLKSIGYTVSGSYSKIELYVNETIVDVNCSYTYNETTIDNCSISITNDGVESEILYVLDQHPNDLDAISLYLSSLTLGRCAMMGLMLVVLDCISL